MDTEAEKTEAQFREMKRCEMTEAQKRRDRMRQRDAAYSRWERENGVAPRFEDHGDKLVEIRGRV